MKALEAKQQYKAHIERYPQGWEKCPANFVIFLYLSIELTDTLAVYSTFTDQLQNDEEE